MRFAVPRRREGTLATPEEHPGVSQKSSSNSSSNTKLNP